MAKKAVIIMFLGVMFLTLMGYSNRSFAEVSIGIGINIPGPPPPLVIHRPPPVVVIPNTYVYFAPDVDVDIFFHHGHWYRPHDGHWYRASGYNGPWGYIAPREVPGVLFGLPPDFRHYRSRSNHIRHEELRTHWERWERDKHWDKRGHGREIEKVRIRERREDNHDRGRGKKGRGRD
jgi:hypothetical protein